MNFTDTTFVKQQYATSANLDARIALHQNFSVASEHFHDWLFDHVHLPHHARVLEIGCGSGALWERVREKIPNSWNITLSDFSFDMVETARAKFQSPVSSLQSDAQQLPFPSQSFDGIFANHMLYRIPDLTRALAEMRRVLKRGGTLYAATDGMGHMRELTIDNSRFRRRIYRPNPRTNIWFRKRRNDSRTTFCKCDARCTSK